MHRVLFQLRLSRIEGELLMMTINLMMIMIMMMMMMMIMMIMFTSDSSPTGCSKDESSISPMCESPKNHFNDERNFVFFITLNFFTPEQSSQPDKPLASCYHLPFNHPHVLSSSSFLIMIMFNHHHVKS